MASINWDETSPADTALVSGGDDAIRSLKTSIRQGLDAEHVWPSSSGDAGVHRLGSARAYVGSQSQVSSSGTDGRLMWTSDTSRLFHVGSGGTSLVGGSRVLSVGTDTGFTYPQRHQWVEEFGIAQTVGSTGSATVSIPSSGYSGNPYVFLTQTGSIGAITPCTLSTGTIGGTSFYVFAWNNATLAWATSVITFLWRSIGTRVL